MNKPRGRPFQPGNTLGRGRPKGRKNDYTLEAQQLLGEYASHITRKCISQGMQGDPTAMRLCMERITPALREGTVSLPKQRIGTAEEVGTAMDQVWRWLAAGKITPTQAGELTEILQLRSEVIEKVDFEKQIAQLEQKTREGNK